jgi:hypothetical protein
VDVTGWSPGLEVIGGGRGVVSHAGLVLLRHLADKTCGCRIPHTGRSSSCVRLAVRHPGHR